MDSLIKLSTGSTDRSLKITSSDEPSYRLSTSAYILEQRSVESSSKVKVPFVLASRKSVYTTKLLYYWS